MTTNDDDEGCSLFIYIFLFTSLCTYFFKLDFFIYRTLSFFLSFKSSFLHSFFNPASLNTYIRVLFQIDETVVINSTSLSSSFFIVKSPWSSMYPFPPFSTTTKPPPPLTTPYSFLPLFGKKKETQTRTHTHTRNHPNRIVPQSSVQILSSILIPFSSCSSYRRRLLVA